MLYHYYEIDRRGVITKANIVTPTAHNFLNLEESLKKLVTENIDKPEDELILMCEMLVRAYDPCFSCSVLKPCLTPRVYSVRRQLHL